MVGLCDEELRLVQRWTGLQVADIMRSRPETGGGLLVTDMRRKMSIFELKPCLMDYVQEKLRKEGSNLSGVTTSYFAWAAITMSDLKELLPDELEPNQRKFDTGRFISPVKNSKVIPSSSKKLLFSDLPDMAIESCEASPKLMAMDTDDLNVNKKVLDDEFVDVVGDYSSNNLIPPFTPSSSMAQEHFMSKILRQSNKFAANSSDSKLNQNNPSSNFVGIGKDPDWQTISAPGGYSAWCARVGLGITNKFNQSGRFFVWLKLF